MKAKILALVILLTAATANAQLSILPGDNAVNLGAGEQNAPAIARGNNSLLAVWTDNRPNPYGSYTWSEYETSRDIYGLRIDLAGNVLDSVPIAIVARKSIQGNPKVAWNGSNWLVVYESYDLNGTGYYYEKSLEAVRVSPSGQVLDVHPIKLYGLKPSGGLYWTMASDGNNWVVVNQGNSTSGDIVAVRISPDGLLLDPATRALVRATYYGRGNLKVAHAAGVFLLTFDEYYDTSAVRFDANLNLLDTNLIQFLDTPLSDLTSNGTEFYAVWNQQLPTFEMAVFGSRVNTDGQKLDGNGVNISGSNAPQSYTNTGVVWDGANWKATWFSGGTVRLARVNDAGTVLDPGGVAVPGPQTGPSASDGNGGVQLIWSDEYDVFSAHISANNVAGSNRPLSLSAPQQLRSDIAASGTGYMLVYRSVTANGNRILAQPLDATGTPLTAEPVQLDVGGGDPNVAWNGSLYLAAWGRSDGIVAQRLLPSGVKVDPIPFMVMTPGFGAADVAAIGDTFLITGRQFGYNPEIIKAISARVRGADGAVLDPTPLLLGGQYVSRPPTVTSLGNRFFVAFISNATHDNPAATTSGFFVEPTTGNIAPAGNYFSFSTSGTFVYELGLASSGNEALLVQSLKLSGSETDLVARVIQPDGVAGPQLDLTPWVGNQYRPRAAWDGTNFLVVYQDQKNRVAEWGLEQLDARSDLFGMRINSSGTPVDPQGFVFSAFDSAETDPSVTSFNGVSLLSGSIMMNDTQFANYRIAYQQLGAGNQWPVAVINASATTGDVPLTINFTSTGSIDPDGTIVGYRWDFNDGTVSTAVNPTYTFTIPSEHSVILTVTDNQGAQTRQALKINATAPNQLPVAIARADRYSGNPPLDVVLFADDSYDPDGFIGNIEWQFSDGGDYWGSPAYHTFETNGIHTVTLNCYDGRGGIGTTTLTIYVGITPTPTPNPTPVGTPTPTPMVTPTVTPGPSTTPMPTASATPTSTVPISTPTPNPTTTPSPAPAQAMNISTRLMVDTGNKVMIGGFIIMGAEPKKVVVRGLGPSLTGFGLTDILADPVVVLRRSDGGLVMQNDNWQDDPAQASQLIALGLDLSNPQESGLVATLQPGSYTAVMSGANSANGVGLIEIYDADESSPSRLANISTRGFVQNGDNAMIGGVILGHSEGDASVVVRGIGPSLSEFGLNDVLNDPILEVRDSNGSLLTTNDNWQDNPVSAAELIARGLAPQNPLEPAIYTMLPPGAFTAILSGIDGTIGLGLVEVYR